MKYKKIFVGFSYSHHGNNSGYDQISNYIDYDLVLRPDKLLFFKLLNLLKPVLSKFIYFDKWYFRLVELFTKIRCLFLKDSIIHFIYPETFIFTKNFLHNSNKIAATFHLPEDLYEKLDPVLKAKHKKLDLAIVISQELKPYFESVLNSDKVIYIPHGVNTDYFKPDNSKSRQNRILLVGNWLRDFDFASKTFDILHQLRPDIEIVVISLKNNYKYFENQSYVNFQYGISDSLLLEYYQTSKILFLPLNSLTANNAILEATSTGCSVFLTISQFSEGYFTDEQVVITNGSPENVANELIIGIDKYQWEKQLEISTFVKDHYSWQVTAGKTINAFNRLMNTPD